MSSYNSSKATAGGATITVCQGDITRQATDAIVNAANSSLLGGGGVDGAIHRAGGPTILEECKAIKKLQGGCPAGEAVITSGGNLQAKYVIHTVGPIFRGGTSNEPAVLAQAYSNSLQLAQQYDLATIAFPSISTGAYGYPVHEAAAVALNAVRRFLITNETTSIKEVRFVLFDPSTLAVYADVLAAL